MKYRVLKDNFLWKKDAILHYHADFGTKGEYISAPIVENSPEWFEPIEDMIWEKFVEKVEKAKRDLIRKMRAEWRSKL